MGIPEARRKPPPCIPTLLYCDCGGAGAAGADGRFCCCSSTFFRVSSTPPLVGACTGVAPPLAGADCEAGATIELGLRSEPAIQASPKLVRKNTPARIAVVRVSKLAVPRLDMKP